MIRCALATTPFLPPWARARRARAGIARRYAGLGRLIRHQHLDCWLGEVRDFDVPLTGALADWDCRNNRLAEFALSQDGFLEAVAASRARYGATRVGIFIGTSTSGVQHTELAYRARDAGAGPLPEWFDQRRTQNIFSVAAFVALRLGLSGAALSISTACSSSAKVFAAASRAIAAGVCDAAVVGGVDSLCLTTLYGFNSLQLISADICRPAAAARLGISIGEAGGFALLDPSAGSSLALLGYGESSDAFHMSLPEPAGRGAIESMRAALARASVAPERSRLHQPARHRHDRQRDNTARAARSAKCSATPRPVVRRRDGPATRLAPRAWSKPQSASWRSNRDSCPPA
jgi:3-oxoacyl-[acyl-carrier-protein] synthase-1